ncbi:MAG: response regulator [Hyphomonadaceae bacterium JAD_PAG50586_4]|nr:MAG: response regulator [Hyphomonadaceae bacterium JAD_PAG50586_4]
MPAGGVLTLSTEEIDLDETTLGRHTELRPGRYVSVCVTDDGEGMSKDTLERAFEPFYTTKEVGKGSGLGLSMVYGFAKQSNGHVVIYSEQGLGKSVRLYLPAAEPEGDPHLTARHDDFAANQGGNETILVVEDDPFVRSHVISSLETLGYRVVVAADGREALNLLHGAARPDLLFTDIVMPGGISGWELAAQARAMLPGLRVLFTSGYPQETLTRRGQVDHHAQLLSKPYRLAELARRVRETLDSLV